MSRSRSRVCCVYMLFLISLSLVLARTPSYHRSTDGGTALTSSKLNATAGLDAREFDIFAENQRRKTESMTMMTWKHDVSFGIDYLRTVQQRKFQHSQIVKVRMMTRSQTPPFRPDLSDQLLVDIYAVFTDTRQRAPNNRHLVQISSDLFTRGWKDPQVSGSWDPSIQRFHASIVWDSVINSNLNLPNAHALIQSHQGPPFLHPSERNGPYYCYDVLRPIQPGRADSGNEESVFQFNPYNVRSGWRAVQLSLRRPTVQIFTPQFTSQDDIDEEMRELGYSK